MKLPELEKLRVALVHELRGNPHYKGERALIPHFIPELITPQYSETLLQILSRLTRNVIRIDGASGFLENSEFIFSDIDFVFNKSRGYSGIDRKSHVPVLCDILGKPYLGSGPYVMALARHKYHCNRILKGIGVRIPNSQFVPHGSDISEKEISFPVFVKPNDLSTCMGVNRNSLVRSRGELMAQVEFLYTHYSGDVVLEEFIPGKELKVALVGSKRPRLVGAVEVMKEGYGISDDYVTNEDLWSGRISYKRILAKECSEEVLNIACYVFAKLGLEDYGRIDLRIGADGNPYIIEVSTHPEINVHSAFTEACLDECKSHQNVIEMLLTESRNRWLDRPFSSLYAMQRE